MTEAFDRRLPATVRSLSLGFPCGILAARRPGHPSGRHPDPLRICRRCRMAILRRLGCQLPVGGKVARVAARGLRPAGTGMPTLGHAPGYLRPLILPARVLGMAGAAAITRYIPLPCPGSDPPGLHAHSGKGLILQVSPVPSRGSPCDPFLTCRTLQATRIWRVTGDGGGDFRCYGQALVGRQGRLCRHAGVPATCDRVPAATRPDRKRNGTHGIRRSRTDARLQQQGQSQGEDLTANTMAGQGRSPDHQGMVPRSPRRAAVIQGLCSEYQARVHPVGLGPTGLGRPESREPGGDTGLPACFG